MRIVAWVGVIAGAVLSVYLSYEIFTKAILLGSLEGQAVYPHMGATAARPLMVAGAVFAAMAALFLVTRRLSTRRPAAWLAVWFVAALAIEGSLCWLAPFRFERIFLSDGANSFNTVASRYTPRTILGDFLGVRRYWAPHAQSNMPGKSVLVYGLRRVTRDPSLLPWLVLVVSNVGGLFLYGIARDTFDRQTGQLAFLLYILTPGKLFFFPLLNTVTPTFVLLSAWLFTRWMGTRNVLYAVLFGASIYMLILFEPLGLAVGMLLLGLIVWGMARGLRWTTFRWQGVFAVLGFAATYAGMLLWTGFDMLPIVRLLAADAVQFNVDAMRPYAIWVRQNLFDFTIAMGACQAVLAGVALLDGLTVADTVRRRLTTPAFLITGALAAMVIVTDVLGVNRGEVVRLWIFMACLCQLPAAYVCARLEHPVAIAIVVAVTVLHDALLASTIGFILPG